MATVILGCGIIGLSTAFYLLESQPGSSIHLVDSSPELFASASGYAAGFIARDWHRPSVVSLAELSFTEHRRLAQSHGGREKWDFASTISLSYEPRVVATPGGKKGEDWLLEGTSRAGVAAEEKRREGDGDGEVPAWLSRVVGDAVSVVDDESGTAICEAAGVHVHYPATALAVQTDEQGELSGVRIGYTDSSKEMTIPTTRILLSAGSWTPQVFTSLFKESTTKIPIKTLAGHSLVVKTPPGKDAERSHAVFCATDGYSPEIFSRPSGVIYLAGLNSDALPLPSVATEAVPMEEHVDTLKKTARRLIVSEDGNELEIVRTGLCFRPVSDRGTPLLGRLRDELLGGGISTKGGSEGGVFIAVGHGPWGISLSLGTGKVMAELMHGKTLSADNSALGL